MRNNMTHGYHYSIINVSESHNLIINAFESRYHPIIKAFKFCKLDMVTRIPVADLRSPIVITALTVNTGYC